MTSLNTTLSPVGSLTLMPSPVGSLTLMPNPVGSLTLMPHTIHTDNFTGARLAIQGSSVSFQFDSSHQQRTISQIDNFTGANIGDSNIQSQFGSNLQVADFNGDGLDDLAVSAPRGGVLGQTFIYFGTSNGLVFNQVLDSSAPGVNNVIGSGDFNGDGLEDLAVADPDSGLSGQVFIYVGTSDGLVLSQVLDPTDL